MNKRLVLFYRGQRTPKEPLPALYRDRWSPFNEKAEFSITSNNRTKYWELLQILGRQVASIAERFGTPRPRTLELIREAQWAILQHYQLWPTPLIDITQNLRVAATFALWEDSASGYVIVVGMPNTTGSVTYDVDQHIVLARLESVCPPEAKRPHIQNAFLVGRHPLYDVGSIGPHRDKNSSPERQRLKRRLVAVIRLDNRNAGFWDDDFQPVSKSRLYPADDDFHRLLCDELRQEILNRAAELETQR
jgi:hypothetical protein